MLDRDESALLAVQLSIEGRALLETRNLVVADIRDPDRLAEVFAEHRPDVVFHAAALKHLPLCEMHPSEAAKTNVWGTAHLLGLALEHRVSRFVNISTDKAADPVSVLGTTKRIAERLTAHADVTRYFMTVEEAVQLVIQAGAIGEHGEAMVLDMGEPVKIADVAKRLADQAGRPIEITYTGLRPGEKLHEVLQGHDEVPRPSAHPLIARVEVEPLDWRHVAGLCSNDPATLRRELDEHAQARPSRITVTD
jgi:FlaA1/EpsC-like NDP-sugar epimerase